MYVILDDALEFGHEPTYTTNSRLRREQWQTASKQHIEKQAMMKTSQKPSIPEELWLMVIDHVATFADVVSIAQVSHSMRQTVKSWIEAWFRSMRSVELAPENVRDVKERKLFGCREAVYLQEHTESPGGSSFCMEKVRT